MDLGQEKRPRSEETRLSDFERVNWRIDNRFGELSMRSTAAKRGLGGGGQAVRWDAMSWKVSAILLVLVALVVQEDVQNLVQAAEHLALLVAAEHALGGHQLYGAE